MSTQTPVPSPTDTLADLATSRAGASRVFARHGMDFCCHGRISLAEACAKKGLEAEQLIAEIEAEERVGEPAARWEARPLAEIVAHIETRFHHAHRQELPRLRAMAQRVEQVHGDKSTCPRGLAEVLGQLAAELEQHMLKEEEVLFPLLAAGRGSSAGTQIQAIEQEHEDAAVQLATIRVLTEDHVPPAEACGTWRALYLGLAEFERELMEHVHLENHLLFPRALRG
jgi:regulator of cell morphogenesis and NO signaling